MFSQNEFASRYSTRSYIYTRHVFFAHLSFQTHDPTQPTKIQIFDPFPTQPNPTRGSTQPMDNSVLHHLLNRCDWKYISLYIVQHRMHQHIITMSNGRTSIYEQYQQTMTYIHYITYKFITRPTCQFASESGALRWRQNDYT